MQLKIDASEDKLRGGFYTPQKIAEFILKWTLGNGDGKSILEPSCGDGIFFKALSESEYKFESILGITQSYGEGGFNNVVISPKIPQKMKFAEGSITTAIGKICVKWERRNSEIHFDFEMPINCKAKFVLEDFESEINAGKSHLIYKI